MCIVDTMKSSNKMQRRRSSFTIASDVMQDILVGKELLGNAKADSFWEDDANDANAEEQQAEKMEEREVASAVECLPQSISIPTAIASSASASVPVPTPTAQAESQAEPEPESASDNESQTSKSSSTKSKRLVKHNYTDHASDPSYLTSLPSTSHQPINPRKGVFQPFPLKLHKMLESISSLNLEHVVSWQPHGRCFRVHKVKAFETSVLTKFFAQRKVTSFQRQLNLYGFNRITSGPDKGSYYHEFLLRGREYLVQNIYRMKVKGTGTRAPSNPDAEPNFYSMPFVEGDASVVVAKSMAKGMQSGNGAGTGVGASMSMSMKMPVLPPLSVPSTVPTLPRGKKLRGKALPPSHPLPSAFPPPVPSSSTTLSKRLSTPPPRMTRSEHPHQRRSSIEFFAGKQFHAMKYTQVQEEEMKRRNSLLCVPAMRCSSIGSVVLPLENVSGAVGTTRVTGTKNDMDVDMAEAPQVIPKEENVSQVFEQEELSYPLGMTVAVHSQGSAPTAAPYQEEEEEEAKVEAHPHPFSDAPSSSMYSSMNMDTSMNMNMGTEEATPATETEATTEGDAPMAHNVSASSIDFDHNDKHRRSSLVIEPESFEVNLDRLQSMTSV